MNKFNIKRILVLSPHTDDGELGAGAFISQLVESGVEKKYIAFSSCKESLPVGFESDTLIKECSTAVKTLGFSKEDKTIYDFPVRNFPEKRQEILEELVKVKKEYAPDTIFVPSSNDIHQDHATVCSEALRAFKNTTVLGYELPWNNISFRSDLVVEVSKSNLDKKVAAIKQYKSQYFRNYNNENYILNYASIRGTQIGVKYAEAFEVLRWIWKLS